MPAAAGADEEAAGDAAAAAGTLAAAAAAAAAAVTTAGGRGRAAATCRKAAKVALLIASALSSGCFAWSAARVSRVRSAMPAPVRALAAFLMPPGRRDIVTARLRRLASLSSTPGGLPGSGLRLQKRTSREMSPWRSPLMKRAYRCRRPRAPSGLSSMGITRCSSFVARTARRWRAAAAGSAAGCSAAGTGAAGVPVAADAAAAVVAAAAAVVGAAAAVVVTAGVGRSGTPSRRPRQWP